MSTEPVRACPLIRRLARSPRWRDVTALAVLFLCVTVFYGRGLRPGYAYLPVDLANRNLPWQSDPAAPLQNWLISDPLYQFYPFLEHNLQVIRQERAWPLWDPNIFTGHPSYADPLYQTFYPPFMLLGLLFGAARGLSIGLWLHALLAAGLTYGLLRELQCTRPAAVLGALVYTLSGYMVTWFETPFWLATLAWLPGVMWACQRAVRTRSLACVGLGGLALGMAALAGQFSIAAVFMLFLGVMGAARSVGMLLRREAGWWRPLAYPAAIGVLGVLLAGVQILPFYELLGLSRRTLAGGMSYDPLPLQQLITLLLPNLFGNPALPSAYWGAGNYSEMVIYSGSLALLLALPAIIYPRKSGVRSLLATALLMLWLILGLPGVRLLGGIPLLRYVSLHRTVFILPLILAILAAKSLSLPKMNPYLPWLGLVVLAMVGAGFLWANPTLYREHGEVIRGTAILTAVVLAAGALLLWLHNRLRQPWWSAVLLIALAFGELYLLGARYNPRGRIDKLLQPTGAVAALQQVTQPARIAVLQRGDILFGPNILGVYSLAEAGGYSSLVLQPYYDLVAAGDPVIDIPWASRASNMLLLSKPTERLLDLLNVRYVAARDPLPDPGVVLEDVNELQWRLEPNPEEYFAGISGRFYIASTALNRIDLHWHMTDPNVTKYSAIFQLWRGHVEEFIFEQVIPAEQTADGSEVTLYIEPQRDAPGSFYTWSVGLAPLPEYTFVNGLNSYPDVLAYGASWAQIYAGELYLWERLPAYPRARVEYAAEQAADNAALTARLLDTSFDLRHTALSLAPLDLPQEPPQSATQAEIELYTSTRVVVRARAEQAGLLVLADQYYPGWQVTVDGAPAEILRINAVQRGVLLAAGEHLVEFTFRPTKLWQGLLCSAVGLLGCLALVAIEWLPARCRTRRAPLSTIAAGQQSAK